MNAQGKLDAIERDLNRAVTDSERAKRVLSDALWRLGQVPAFEELPRRAQLLLTIRTSFRPLPPPTASLTLSPR